jgi:hypothetical protein
MSNAARRDAPPGNYAANHADGTLGALEVQLTPPDLADLQANFSKLTVHDGRLNDPQMQLVERAG